MNTISRVHARYCPVLAFVAVFAANFLLHAAPPTADQTRAQLRPHASRWVTGPSGPLNEAIAAGATVEITLQPVEPKTQPPSSYPPGSSIIDQTLTLGSVPARVWVEVHVTAWAPEILHGVQVTISATDADMDGGGYSGAAADCNGGPSIGAGDLAPAIQSCNNTTVCRNEISGRTSNCNFGEPSICTGGFCQAGFIDGCDSESIRAGLAAIPAVDVSTLDYRFGIALNAQEEETCPDFNPSYLGTFVIDAPANARGSYTIDIEEADTFLLTPGFPPGNRIPIAVYKSAVIKTACSVQADPSGISKTRFISFSVPDNVAGIAALRVTPISLHHVTPPYTGGASIPFTAFESGPNCGEAGGCVRWVGPPTQYMESSSDATPFYASSLQCTPHYQDWSTIGLLHVTGSAIVPSSVYEVEAIDESCLGNEETCTVLTPAVSLSTTRWGDVIEAYNPPSITAQPDVADIAALVAKFRSAPGAPTKARAMLTGDDAFGNINISADLGFSHIAGCVEAFRGKPYPHTISSCP